MRDLPVCHPDRRAATHQGAQRRRAVLPRPDFCMRPDLQPALPVPVAPRRLFQRQRPESTYCGRSRPRPWTPRLGGVRAYRSRQGKRGVRPLQTLPNVGLGLLAGEKRTLPRRDGERSPSAPLSDFFAQDALPRGDGGSFTAPTPEARSPGARPGASKASPRRRPRPAAARDAPVPSRQPRSRPNNLRRRG